MNFTQSSELSQVLEFVKDPAKLEDVAARLADLQERESAARAGIAQAEETARTAAEQILAAAKENADRMMEEARDEIDAANRSIAEQTKSLEDQQKRVVADQQEIFRASAEIASEHERLTTIRRANENMQAEAGEKESAAAALTARVREFAASLEV